MIRSWIRSARQTQRKGKLVSIIISQSNLIFFLPKKMGYLDTDVLRLPGLGISPSPA